MAGLKTKRKWLILALTLLLVGGALGLCLSANAAGSAKWPAAVGQAKTNGKLRVDSSTSSEGYFQASISSASKRKLKLRVVKGGETLTYDLNGNGNYEVFPFQLGSGSYEISLYENVSGKKYSSIGKMTVSVKLSQENVAFLYPNQYVDYTKKSEAVAMGATLCEGKSDKEAYDAVCSYMKSGAFVYDYVKALTVKPGMLPDIDGSFAKHMGVCQDLSAIMVCMLRTNGIPARLVIGYADKNYHAWTTATVDGKELFFDPTAALNAISTVKEYSVERFY